MSHLFLQGDARHVPLATGSVDLVFGSPPYLDSRLYLEDGVDLGIARNCREWVDWMMDVSREAVRVSRGAVLWVVSGNTRDRNYRPGPEGLIWKWFESGGCQECPCYWHRVGISGSGGDQWFRKDVEYVVAFKRDPKLPWSDNTACGHPPKWAPGGEMSHRNKDGDRRNKWGMYETSVMGRSADGVHKSITNPSRAVVSKAVGKSINVSGERRMAGEVQNYIPPALANPGNYLALEEESSVVNVNAGGGRMGHEIAHENEAPFPEALAEFFIKSLCPEWGIVADFFSGSGTTVAVAERLGRHGIGIDLRMSQCKIGMQRLTRPHQPVIKAAKKEEHHPLFPEVA
jgi:DNA methylase